MRNRGKGFKEAKACLSILQEVQVGGALDPGQKEKLSRATATLRNAMRQNPQNARQLFVAVKGITEVLWDAFSQKAE
jgi:hypothetical protein